MRSAGQALRSQPGSRRLEWGVMKPRRLTLEPTEQEIAREAYFLWEQQGRPAGRDLDTWLAARERLRHRAAVYRPRRAQPPPRNAQPVPAGIR